MKRTQLATMITLVGPEDIVNLTKSLETARGARDLPKIERPGETDALARVSHQVGTVPRTRP
jgi:hypothetical protein